jgi:4'-phosphopantetheinyl transferase EntD
VTDPSAAAVLLAALLPAPVVTVVTTTDLDEPLLPPEEGLVAAAVDGRRREFTTGRALARRALTRLGGPVGPLVAGPRGAPVWPAGLVGSLTHCPGLRAVAVARCTDVLALGLDAEENEPLPGGVLDVVAGRAEQQALAALPHDPGAPAWDRLLFSAKESVYKLWSPATGLWLDFEDVVVDLDPDGTFTARLLRRGLVLGDVAVHELVGRWATSDQHVVTAIAVPA